MHKSALALPARRPMFGAARHPAFSRALGPQRMDFTWAAFNGPIPERAVAA
jgi:hypothetical protein